METKRCPKCGEGKPLSDYYKNVHQSDGYATYCKKCSRIIVKEWSEKNKEKVLEKNKKRCEKWRSNKDNREKANAAAREYKKKNPEKIKAGARRGRVNCCPSYIKLKLKNQGFLDSQITPDVIEEKRNIIKVKRIIKQIKNKQNYE